MGLSGMSLSTPLRMNELLTELASHGSDDWLSGTATSQATSSTATTETTAPPASSTRLRGAAADRAAQPGADEAGQRLPGTARPKTAANEMTTRDRVAVENWSAISGPSCRPISAPPKNPANDSTPMRKPWR